ncbi:hypothetical protein CK203_019294 [Vitis vinifera]|uniref:DUF4283 domain-containing protein n=1 Tax=Vitis vinifera TaxID=29760 RepID=A0A438J7J4_VITVI|nr:hypothetical protein CK203_019294 [Vitis vinifera]
MVRPQGSDGPPLPRCAVPCVAFGPAPFEAFPHKFGLSYLRLLSLKGWAKEKEPVGLGLGCRGLALPLAEGRAQLGLSCPFNISGPSLMGGPDQSISSLWVYESLWRPSAEEQLLEESSKTDCALMEKASRPHGYWKGVFSDGVYYSLELMEDNNGNLEESGEELCLASAMPLEVRGWEEASWEESDLARFSKFLRFSTKGLEKDILEFLEEGIKKVQCKEKDARFWLSNDVKGVELEWDKIQTMSEGVVRSVGSGRFLDWEPWVLKALREGKGVYVEELGAIRGIWDDPWCVGGDFNVTLSQRERSSQGSLNGAMRRFAQVVDDLELLDLLCKGLCSPGARGGCQSRLPRPTSDHFPILLKGGGLSRGPSPFRFETCGLRLMVLRISFKIGGKERGGEGGPTLDWLLS